MAGIVLGGGRGVPKDDVPQKGAQGHGDHDPSVVRHEDQPAREPTSQPPSLAGLAPPLLLLLFFFGSSSFQGRRDTFSKGEKEKPKENGRVNKGKKSQRKEKEGEEKKTLT